MQWTIDPRDVTNGKVSADVCSKVLTVVDARVIVRTSRRGFRVPSWTQEGLWHQVVLTVAPDGWKAICDCDATGWCHHGYAAALELERLDGLKIPVPGPARPARWVRSRPLTVIPGGRS